MRSSTVTKFLERASGSKDSGLRFVDRRERSSFLSWSELFSEASAVGGRLLAAGVEPGDLVALIFPTGRDFFLAYFGSLIIGAVPTPMYPPVRLGRLGEYHRRTAGMVRRAGVRLILADDRVRRLLGETAELARPELGCLTLDGLPAANSAEIYSASPEDVALVQFSSGTTVEPKPVALTHRALVAQTEILNGFWPQRPDHEHSGLSWLPLYHDMGLIGCVLPAMERIATLTLINPETFVSRPACWLRGISRYRATISPAPNFAFGLAVQRIRDEELEGVDLSCWEVALNGAESVSALTMERFAQRFARWGFRREALTPVYGLSEASLAVTFSPIDKPFRAERFERGALVVGRAVRRDAKGQVLVSTGRAVPDFAIQLRGEEGLVLPEGVVGRLWVRGPSIMKGYLGDPEATSAAIQDGWLDTGDLGFLDEGDLFLTGRAKDVIIIRGRNVAPEEVEASAWSVEGARTGCAVAVGWLPEGADHEELLVFVEATREASAEQISAMASRVEQSVLAITGLAAGRVEILAPGTLPRTSSGKLRRAETRRRWLAGELTPPESMNAWRLLSAVGRSSLSFTRLRFGGLKTEPLEPLEPLEPVKQGEPDGRPEQEP